MRRGCEMKFMMTLSHFDYWDRYDERMDRRAAEHGEVVVGWKTIASGPSEDLKWHESVIEVHTMPITAALPPEVSLKLARPAREMALEMVDDFYAWRDPQPMEGSESEPGLRDHNLALSRSRKQRVHQARRQYDRALIQYALDAE